jgi:hypothetical protein
MNEYEGKEGSVTQSVTLVDVTHWTPHDSMAWLD